MNQEKFSQEEVENLIENLESIGIESKIFLTLSFEVNPNEFLYTNIKMFVDSYWGKNSFHSETKVNPRFEMAGGKGKITISGIERDVRKIQKEFPSFSWVKSESVKVISEERG